MRSRLSRRIVGWTFASVLGLAVGVHAVRVIPAALDVVQAAGATDTYVLTIYNDTDAREELRLYVGDWQRLENGEHDWDVPVNGARWVFADDFSAGEERVVRYTVDLESLGDVGVNGTYRTSAPQVVGDTTGSDRVAIGTASRAEAETSGTVAVERIVESIEGRVAVVALHVRVATAFTGLTLFEVYERAMQIESLDAQGARFDTINRSNAAGVVLSHDRITLEPDESKEVLVTVTAPPGIDGMTWSAVFVETEPRIVEQGGTRVLSIYRTAIKIYVTATGTVVQSGEISQVRAAETDPLAIETSFVNTGNVQLAVAGTVEIIDRTGEVILQLAVAEFKVLPGATRVVTATADGSIAPLAAGVYQAVVSLEYGGDNPIVGVRGFRIR